MPSHEYRVLPAPRRGLRVRGARTAEERFARAVEEAINRMAREGWDYLRTDTLPCEERQGWFSGRVTVFQTLLVFRRAVAAGPEAVAPAAPPRRRPAVVPPPEPPPRLPSAETRRPVVPSAEPPPPAGPLAPVEPLPRPPEPPASPDPRLAAE